MSSSKIFLDKAWFVEKEKTIVVNGDITVSLFLFESGVHALRIKNRWGEVVMLPFQGQQIWSCAFDDKELAMKSMFAQPVATSDYLGTYGGFLLHCGATAMGVPSEEDTHALHGELPNAVYQKAFFDAGSDEQGRFISVGGAYEHIVAFNHHYLAEPQATIREDSSLIDVAMSVTNLKSTEMDLMYMMHINFRPTDNGELVYSAHAVPEKVRPHVSVPSHMKSAGVEKLVEFMHQLEEKPDLHHVLKPGLAFDPEIVFTVIYESDSNGDAHSMMVYPDGYANYVSHRPEELEFGIRWISRSKDQDALGLVLPATAEHKGYLAEKEKGNLKTLTGGKTSSFHARAGLLIPQEAQKMRGTIADIL